MKRFFKILIFGLFLFVIIINYKDILISGENLIKQFIPKQTTEVSSAKTDTSATITSSELTKNDRIEYIKEYINNSLRINSFPTININETNIGGIPGFDYTEYIQPSYTYDFNYKLPQEIDIDFYNFEINPICIYANNVDLIPCWQVINNKKILQKSITIKKINVDAYAYETCIFLNDYLAESPCKKVLGDFYNERSYIASGKVNIGALLGGENQSNQLNSISSIDTSKLDSIKKIKKENELKKIPIKNLSQEELDDKFFELIELENYTEAFKYAFESAHYRNNANAQYNLGLMYAKGEGVKSDENAVIWWYVFAAKQGSSSAIEIIEEIKGLVSWEECVADVGLEYCSAISDLFDR